MSSAPAGRSGSASSIVATARLTGQTLGAALAASCFSFVGRDGAVVALALAAGVRRARQPDEFSAADRRFRDRADAASATRRVQNIPSSSTRFFFFERCQTTPG